MKFIHKILTIVLILTIVFTNVLTTKEIVKAEENTNFCLFCNGDKDEAKKEKQFAEKIKIIKDVFGPSIDSATLASTVLYLSFEEGVNRYYQEDFNADAFEENWNNIKDSFGSNSENEEDWAGGANSGEIDLLTAATIVMVLSNGVLGTYDEEKYKEALMLDKGFTNAVIVVIPNVLEIEVNSLLCSSVVQGVATIATAINGAINNLNPLTANKDFIKDITNMNNICKYGFLEATYPSVQGIKDTDKKKIAKENLADKIIEMAKMYAPWFNNEETNCGYGSNNGDATNWRQGQNSPWSTLTLGKGGQTVAQAGCTSVSMAYLIQKSGTVVNNDNFDPGKFVESVNYVESNLDWDSIKEIAPKWVMDKQNVDIKSYNANSVATVIENELNTPIGNNNQAFVIIYMTGHWVAVDHVENGTVYVLDPAASDSGLVTLDAALKRDGKSRTLISYNTFYATDVAYVGNSASSYSSSGNNYCSSGTGSGNIIIPNQYGGGGYTITTIDTFNWIDDCKKVYDLWIKSGAKTKDGIAVIDGRYLIACTTTFGKVGDKIDFFLDDGTKIESIMFDTKRQNESTPGCSKPSNKWGHCGGQNVLEFEVLNSYYQKYGNPGTDKWYSQWANKRVASATNLGSIF